MPYFNEKEKKYWLRKLRTKKLRGIKIGIIICFGDRTRSGTFFAEKY